MASLWRRGSDSLKNGVALGIICALGIIFGEKIMNFLGNNFPKDFMYLGNWSVQVYLIVLFMIIGYIVDRH